MTLEQTPTLERPLDYYCSQETKTLKGNESGVQSYCSPLYDGKEDKTPDTPNTNDYQKYHPQLARFYRRLSKANPNCLYLQMRRER